ncbi:MAG: LysR family transcriptional regulator [Planctomycetota bacterium]|jgi:DNA-binding transcriptional LysR family regulator|nr:LysR family transcriptional regulator [Planctomycetota bacterium]
MDLELRHHRHALALAEHRNFLRAARALEISQPALSRSIQELERRMGATLFSRARGGVEATDVGRIYLAKARAVIVQSGDLEREMHLIRGLEIGELRFGAGVYPSEMFVARAMARMAKAHPSVKLTAVSNSIDTLLQMLRRREIDFAIGDQKTAEAERGLRVTPLAWHRGHLVVRAGHPLLGGSTFKLKDVLRYPLTLTTRVPHDLLSNFLQGEGGKGEGGKRGSRRASATLPAITCDSPAMMKAIVAESDAIGLMPMSLIAREVADGSLVALPTEAPWLGRAFAIIELEDRSLSPSAEQFLRFVRETDELAARVEAPKSPGRTRERAAHAAR